MQGKITSFADVHRLVDSRSDATKRHAYSLEHMHELLEHLGNPHKRLRVIHVAGTSGKTSTAYYTAALLKEAGLRVGLTVSPHVDEINERVQIGLAPLPEAEFCRDFEKFWELLKHSRVIPNYFETFVAFAFWEFAARGVDYAVVEVGIGGLLDSTNVFDDTKKVCVITDIGYDHMKVLGSTLPEIAAQKAGIIKLHNPVFCSRQDNEVMDVIRQTAAQKQADLHILSPSAAAVGFEFLPLFQRRNFGLSLEAVKFALERDGLEPLDDEAVSRAARVKIPARMETVSHDGKTIIVDAAHNAQKLHALCESVRQKYPGQPIAAVVSFADGRSHRFDDYAAELVGLLDHVIITPFSELKEGDRHSVDGRELEEVFRRHGAKSLEMAEGPESALKRLLARPEPVLLVTGSFYLLNHIRPLLAGKG